MDDPENYKNLIKEKIKESLRLTEIQRQQKIASGLYSFFVENRKAKNDKIPFPKQGWQQKWTEYTIMKKLLMDEEFQPRKNALFKDISLGVSEIKNCLKLMSELGVLIKNGPEGRAGVKDDLLGWSTK